jgi:hypothetical protein
MSLHLKSSNAYGRRWGSEPGSGAFCGISDSRVGVSKLIDHSLARGSGKPIAQPKAVR